MLKTISFVIFRNVELFIDIGNLESAGFSQQMFIGTQE